MSAIGKTYVLSSDTDILTGTSGDDYFSASGYGESTFSAGDTIDGGAGIDTLNISVSEDFLGAPPGASIKNIEIVNITSAQSVTVDAAAAFAGATALAINHGNEQTSLSKVTASSTQAVTVTGSNTLGAGITVNGGSTVKVTEIGGGTITVSGAAGAVTVSKTISTGNGASINVAGGTTINISQTSANAVNTTITNGAVVVLGGASTTAVSVVNAAKATASASVAGVDASTVSITDVNGGIDKAGIITNVSVSNFSSLGIASNALTKLSLTGGSGNIIVDNYGLTTPTNKTLGLTINGQTTGTLDDADIYTTLNITTTGEKSTLSNITTGSVTALNVDGTKALTLTSTAGLTKLATVAVSGSAGLKANLSAATVTSVDASATSGTMTVTIDATKAAYKGGSGTDAVTVSGDVSKAISLGAGNDTFTLASGTVSAAVTGGDGTDTLSISAASAATASADSKFAGLVTGFESLTLTGSTNQTIDLAVLGNYANASTSGGNGLTLSSFVSGGTLTLTGAGTAYTLSNTAFTGGANDVVNIKLTDGSGAAVNFASTGITASGVETINITTVDSQETPTNPLNLVTLLGNSAKTITVSGNAGLNLTATDTALTSLDASGITKGGFTFTSGALTAAATIKGSLLGGDTIDAAAATKAVTITEYAGKNTITGSSTAGSTLTGGTGDDTITGGSGKDTIVGGGGNDLINSGSGADSITISGSGSTFENSAVNDSGTNTSTSVQVTELTSTFDIITGVVAGVGFKLANTATLNLTATNLAGTDNAVNFARGTYDAANGIFSYGAAGSDTAVTYDTDKSGSTAYETVILVGYVAASTTAIDVSGLITFA
jgi:S-layer protein